MSSVLSAHKQIPANAGYFITLADISQSIYQNDGTDAAPSFAVNTAAGSLVGTSGVVLRDHGKTLISSARVFRKVQVMIGSGAVENGGTDGVGGEDVAPTSYLTGYIELPGQGTGSGTGSVTPVARLG